MKKKVAKRVTKAAEPKTRRAPVKAQRKARAKPVVPAEKAAGLAAATCGSRPLPPRQTMFVAEYLANGMNATQAAIKAGYSPKTAESQGCRLLRNVKVAAIVAERTEARLEELDYSAERTLREVGRLAFFDLADIFNDDGSLKALKDMSPAARSAIAGLQIEEESFTAVGTDGEKVALLPQKVLTKKVKLSDRRAALDMLMRYHSLYRDKSEVVHKISLEDLILGADEEE